MLGNWLAKSSKVPPCLRPARRDYAQAGVKVLQHTPPPYWEYFYAIVRVLEGMSVDSRSKLI